MKNKHYMKGVPSASCWNWRGKVLMSLVMLMLFGAQVNAQTVAAYTFSQSSGTYVPLTPARTILFTATASATADPGLGDDRNFTLSAGTIPFTFNFKGTGYTGININTNGYATFGATLPTTSDRNGLTNTTAWDASIVAVGRDLSANTNAANLGEISYEVLGTSPNRTFVIQYAKYRRFSSSSTFTENFNFQIRLNEGGGVASAQTVDVVYGACVSTSTSTTASSQTLVGLRGATVADFANRTQTTGWLLSTAGATNTTSISMRHTATVSPASGLTFTWTPPNTCTVALGGTISPASATRCQGQTYAMSSTGFSAGLGTTYAWLVSSTPGGPYSPVVGGTGAATTSYTTAALAAGTYYYVLQTTCSNCGPCSGLSNELTVLVNAAPPVLVTPSSATYCNPGGSPIPLAATGALTYSWSPAAGLSATTGDNVIASPANTTTYTVTGTDANGCTATSTSAITVSAGVVISSTTATPSAVCSGNNSQLNANAFLATNAAGYSFTAGTGGSLDPMSGATTLTFADNDDAPTAAPAPIGFTFNYEGVNYTQYSISQDGWIRLGSGTAVAQFTNSVTSTTNIPKIYPYWDDVSTGVDGNVQVVVNGTAPNRIFVAQWFVTIPRALAGNANSTFQCWLYEGSNKIEFHYGIMNVASMSASVGLTGTAATNFNSVTITTASTSNVTPNNSNAVQPADGDYYIFEYPSAGTYAWSPSTFIAGQEALPNPIATGVTADVAYTVTVTNANGCSATGNTSVTVGTPVVCDSIVNTVACDLTNFNLTAYTTGGGGILSYIWDDGMGGIYPDAATITANLATGSYTFTVIVNDGCGTNCTTSVAVTVGTTPGGVATGPATGLTGIANTYSVTGYAVGSSFQWQTATASGGPYTNVGGNNDTENISFASIGSKYVVCIVTGPNGCQTVTNEVQTDISLNGDNVCGAIPLVMGLNGTYSNVGATIEPGEAQPPTTNCGSQASWCTGSSGLISNTVWFSFVAPASGKVSINFIPGNWDSQIAVWSAASCNDLLTGAATLVAANDDSASSPFNAWIAPVCVVPGQTYWVQVDGFGSTTNAAFSLLLNSVVVDADLDGYTVCNGDCDDTNAAVNPVATEICNGIDDDCDGLTDDADPSVVGQSVYFADTDGDSYGNPSSSVIVCFQPVGYVTNNYDCDDGNFAVNPAATEICNGIDDDCDGLTDDADPGVIGQSVWYADTDGDNYGNPSSSVFACFQPIGYVADNTDCDDGNGAVYPGAFEVCNGIDDDCDGLVDEGTIPTGGTITGSPTTLCWPSAPGIGSYTISAIPHATSWFWTVPAGMFITGGQGTQTITIQWTAVAVHNGIIGNVTCVASNACGAGPVSTLGVAITTVAPVTPGSISGTTKVCPGDVVMYSVAPVARASFYTWTLPTGMTGSSSTNIISVTVGPTYVGGTISVTAGNPCGSGGVRNKSVSQNLPLTPGTISGPANGVCGNTGVVYSIAPVVNATGYVWGVGVDGSIPGSITGTSVSVDWSGSMGSSQVFVASTNGCGTSGLRTLTVTGYPGIPSIVTGAITVCTGDTNHYSVNTVPGATSYTWTAPGTIIAGQGTKEIDVNWGGSPASGQQITVRASNACGIGPIRTLSGIAITICPRLAGNSIEADLNVYPNPAKDEINVSFNVEGKYVISVTDVAGRNLINSNGEASGISVEQLSVSQLSSGVYFINLQTEEGSQKMRFVVE